MINPEILLADLKRLLGQLEGDLRERADEVPTLGESLRTAYDRAKQAERTAQPFETWREEYLTQVAAAWILACVFVRFIEDNALIDTPLLAGSGPRLAQAKDQRTLYFQQHPTDSDRDYLYSAFRKVEALPAAAPLFDERHNPLWAFGVSGDGATLLIEFWQRVDPAKGALAHDFSDPALNTRFLGDLYQDLSEAARKKYALLQTPEFVEEFILDRTLTPAIAEFRLADLRLIDPACGSGHFLLGAFHRLLHQWQEREPAVNVRELVQRALNAVHGIDLNPYAVAIARFRLLVAALKASDVHRLADAPAFHMNLATGDSLLHGPRPGGGQRQMYLASHADPLQHVYETEDADELRRILGGQYHVVVGNPPYISVKDPALNRAYRERYGSCYGKYQLVAPFLERFFDLALSDSETAGHVGLIVSNAFMKREFGTRLIEEYFPRWDLTHVIDTSRAHIPGHGTPTAILLGRHRPPVSATVRVVSGLKAEMVRPQEPSKGQVWMAITSQVDRSGSSSEYATASDTPRSVLRTHPWSIGGGGLAELKAVLDQSGQMTLEDWCFEIGVVAATGEDEAFILDSAASVAAKCEHLRPIVKAEFVRDWAFQRSLPAVWVYDDDLKPRALAEMPRTARFLWPFRQLLAQRRPFGKSLESRGIQWYEWQELYRNKLGPGMAIAGCEVATHNQFALDRSGTLLFKNTIPVIKLREEQSEDDALQALAVLNSSLACCWIKQVAHNKGGGGIGGGLATESWEQFYVVNTSALSSFPMRLGTASATQMARSLEALARLNVNVEVLVDAGTGRALPPNWATPAMKSETLAKMIALQEELDWECYRLYGLLKDDCNHSSELPALLPGQRAFEIVMARRMAAGELDTSWFDRHGSKPVTELPADWPAPYRDLVMKRIALIENDPNIALIEQPEYKRRWNVEPWEQQQERALREWLGARLEASEFWSGGDLTSVSKLADRVRKDVQFMEVAELYRRRADFDVTTLITELVESDAVPFLPVLRYTSTGLRKRATWEQTWELQRREDAGENVDEIPVAPKYTSSDFLNSTFWSLRTKLDVPKERFVSYPHAEREADQTLVIGWAGWDHLQQAKALAAYFVRMKEQEGWAPERLNALLTGLLELIPWLKQWHNDLDPAYGIGMGDYFAGFVDEEARALGFTLDDVRAWQPPAGNTRRRRRASV